MSVDKSTVERIADLARIKVEEDELEDIASELNDILVWVEQLNEVDTSSILPMSSVNETEMQWRSDQLVSGTNRESVISNSDYIIEGFFTVPKVVE